MKHKFNLSKFAISLIIFITFFALVIAPASYLLISQSGDLVFTNMTEGTALGARLSASVLSMDFNNPAENILNIGYQNGSLYQSGTYIRDGSIYNNFGTSSGLTKQYWWNGNTNGASVINGSLQFDGVNDYISVPLSLNNSDAITISLWIQPGNTTTTQNWIWTAASGQAYSNFIYVDGSTGNLATSTYNSGDAGYRQILYPFSSYIGSNKWVYITIVRANGQNTQLYINGTWVANATVMNNGAFVQSAATMAIGSSGPTFNGSIDDFIIYGRALNATEISTIYSEGLAGRTVNNLSVNNTRIIPSTNRIAYWSFDVNESGSNVTDYWGGYNVSCIGTNCPIWNASAGVYGTAGYGFTESGKILNISDTNGDLSLNNSGTISMWANFYNTGGTSVKDLISKGISGNNYSYGWGNTAGNLRFDLFKGDGSATYASKIIPYTSLNEWHFYTATWNTTALSIYQDGVLQGSRTAIAFTSVKNLGQLKIGSYSGVGYSFIDEVMLFNKTLTDSEVQDMYNQQRLHLKLDELSGTTASTISGNSAGTLTGYPTTDLTAPIYNSTGGVNGSGAYVFDGISQLLTGITPFSSTSSKGSISIWIKSNASSAGTPCVYSIAQSNANQRFFALYFSGTTMTFFKMGNYGVTVTAPYSLTDNRWHHVVQVYDDSSGGVGNTAENTFIYLDGVLMSDTVSGQGGSDTAGGWTIGALNVYSNQYSNFFNGTMDNFQLFNKALSSAEVLALYNGTNNQTVKYGPIKNGDFTSGVFYNSTQTYWNVSLATADTTSRSGIVNSDNSINLSNPNLGIYLPLDNDYLDVKGNNNFTCSGTLCPNNATGLVSDAKFFNGDYLTTTNATVDDTTAGISFWIRPTVSGSSRTVFGKVSGGCYDTALQFWNTNYIGIYIASGGSTQETFAPLTLNDWQHFVFTCNGNVCQGYKNGILTYNKTTQNGNVANLNRLFTNIGSSCSATDPIQNTSLDEIIYLKNTLTQSDVQSLYKSGLSQHANTNITIQTRTANSYNVSDPSLVFFMSAKDKALIFDSSDPAVSWRVGAWTYYGSAGRFNQDAYYLSSAAAQVWEYWNITVPTTGTYKVYVSGGNSALNTNAVVNYSLNTDDGSFVVPVDTYSATNTLIGTYNFTAGTIYTVNTTNKVNSGSGNIMTDAIIVTQTGTAALASDVGPNVTSFGCDWNNSFGLIGGGYKCFASNHWMSIDQGGLLNGATSGTYSAWEYITTQIDYAGIVSVRGSQFNGLVFSSAASKQLLLYTNSLNPLTSSAVSMSPGWHHYVGTFNSTTRSLYYDGVLVGSGAAVVASISNDGTFLINKDTGGRDNGGYIDEVRIYNRSLSAAEILDLYNLGSTHILWNNDFSNEQVATDGNGITNPINTSGKFMQFHANLNTNTTDVSPYVLSYNISNYGDIYAPNVTSSIPANNSVLNNGSINGINFTASLTDDFTGIQNATLNIYNASNNQLVNSTTATEVNSGKAIYFGSDSSVNPQYATVPGYNINNDQNWTMSFWTKIPTTSPDGSIYYLVPNYAFYAQTTSGNFRLTTFTPGAGYSYVNTNKLVRDNVWHHIVIEHNASSSSATVFIDNVAYNGQIAGLTGMTATANIGYVYQGYQQVALDEFYFWNRTLTSADVSILWNSGKGLYGNVDSAPFNSGLVNGYHFENSTGGTATDWVSGVNWTLYNSPTYILGKVKSPTNTTFDSNVLATTVGIVVSLADGIYNWFWNIFDFNGNLFSSANNTVTVDNTAPNATLNTPQDNFVLNYSTQDNAFAGIAIGNFSLASSLASTFWSSLIFSNMTEGTNIGARTSAAVLSIDFNTPGENLINLNYSNQASGETGTYIKEGSIYNNFGTSSGLTKQYWWNGNTNGASVINGSLQFDGADDYINITGDNGLFNGAGKNLTISVWFKTSPASQGVILAKGWEINGGYALTISNGIFSLGMKQSPSGNSCFDLSSNSLTNNTWHNAIVIFNISAQTGNIYIDGILNQNGNPVLAGTCAESPDTLTIGRRTYSSPISFNGSIDDVILWGRALNATEISTIYSEGLAGRTVMGFTDLTLDNSTRIIPESGRVAYYNFNVNDSTSNVRDLWGINNLSCISGTSPCPPWNATGGVYGSAAYKMYNSGNSNDAFKMSNSTLLNGSSGVTLAAWVKTSQYWTGGEGIIWMNDGTYFWGLRLVSPGYYAMSYGFYNVNTPIPDYSKWHLLVGTMNQSGASKILKLYMDGQFIGTTTENTAAIRQAGNITIGEGFAFGYIDEAMIFNRSLTDSEVSDMYNGQRAHYKLDELSGTVANTSSVASSGTLTNYPTTALTAPTYNATGGVNGSGAYVFDGVDDYLSISNGFSSISASNDHTISLWANVKGFTDVGAPFGVSTYYPQFSSPSIFYWNSGANYRTYTLNTPISSGQWYHLVFIKNGTSNNGYLYINNILQTSYTGTLDNTPALNNLLIGSVNGHDFNGSIDNIQIFNRALSASEIMNLYNGTNANRTIKYSSTQGDFTSGVFYNSTQTYWNVSLSTADTTSRRGIVNVDNSINISNPNLVSYWALDGNFIDSHGLNNGTGVVGTNGGLNNASGISSSAIKFDGVDDYVANNSVITAITPYTFSAWFKPANTITSSMAPYYLLGSLSSSSDTVQGIALGSSTGACTNEIITIVASSGAQIGRTCYYSPTSIDTNWHNLIASWNGTQYEIYLDNNKLTGSTRGTANTQALLLNFTSSLRIGSNGGAGQVFNGTMDEVLIYNTSLSASQVQQLYKSGLSQHANTNVTIQTRTGNNYNVRDPSLVGFWAINNFNFSDSKGTNSGLPQNGVKINKTGCKIGNCAQFDGVDDYVNLGNTPNLNLNGANFTISAWINLKSNSTNQNILSKGYYNIAGWRFMVVPGSRLYLETNNAGSSIGTSTALNSFSLNQWHNVLVNLNGTNAKIYIDGIDSTNASGVHTVFTAGNAYNAVIGVQGLYAEPFNGSIDEVAIYNRSLSASEISNLYNSGLGMHAPADANLVSTWYFDEDEILGTDLHEGINQGGCSGTTCPTLNSSGVISNSLNINAASAQLINIANPMNFAGFTQQTYCAWVNIPASQYGYAGIVSGRGPSNNLSSMCFDSAGGTKLEFWLNGNQCTGNAGMAINKWNFACITYKAGGSNDDFIYLNGQLDKVCNYADANVGTNFTSVQLGYDNFGGHRFNGLMDEVRVYNRSLSAAEVLDLYNLGSTHISDWTNWSAATTMSDGGEARTNAKGKFVQYKTTLNSNTTDVSPYVISQNVTSLGNIGNIKNLTVNITDNLAGVANATLIVVNATNPNQQIGNATVTLNNPLITTVGIVVSLVDGLYDWFYRIFDLAGNMFTTSNNTLIADSVAPSIVLNSPANNYYTNAASVNFTANVSDAVSVASATLNIYNSSNELAYSNSLNGINSPFANVGINQAVANDGNYTWTYSVSDLASLTNLSLTNRTIVIDRTLPISTFISPTPANDSGSNIAIIVALNATELNLKNATFNWNGADYQHGSANFTLQDGFYYLNETNRTALLPGQFYTYYLLVCDLANNCNTPETRLVKGNTAPVIVFGEGTTGPGYYNSSEIIANVTSTDNEGNMNYSAVFLYYRANWSDSISLFNETNSTENYSINYYLNYSNLAEGIYYLNSSATDIVGEYVNTSTRTIILDRTGGNATSLVENNSYFNYTTLNLTANLTDNLGIANATLNIYNSTNSLINSSVVNFVEGTLQTTVGIVVNLVDGIYSWFYNLFDFAGNSFDTNNYTLTTDTVAPYLYSIVYSPSDNDSIDPLTNMQFNVSIRDFTSGANSAILEMFDGTSWQNYSMALLPAESILDGIWSVNFNTSSTDTDYTFKIFANDTSGNLAESDNFTFNSNWDCSWTVSNNLKPGIGYSETKLIDYMIVNNTGDSNYSGGCNLQFKTQHNLDTGKMFLNGLKSLQYSLLPGQRYNISVNYTFGVDMRSEQYIIATTSYLFSDAILRNTTGTAVTNQQGPYLYQTISGSPSIVYIKPGNFNLGAHISNLMGGDTYNESNTAFNVTSNWAIDSAFTNVTGNLTSSFNNMSDSNENSLNLELNATNLDTLSQNTYSFILNSTGFDFNGNLIQDMNNNSNFVNSVNISFLCYPLADGFDAQGCWPLDPDTIYCGNGKIDSSANETCSSCPEDVGVCQTTTTTIGGGAGGGGGGGGGAGSLSEKSDATFELLSGKEQEFTLRIDNKLQSDKRNINVSVSGIDPSYLSFAKSINLIRARDYVELKVRITAPAYFTQGKYVLKFNFAGDILGNTTTRYTETKTVTLYITELTRITADTMLNESSDFITQMNESGMILKDVEAYLASMSSSYNDVNFLTVRENFNKLKQIYTAAFEAKKLIEEMNKSILEAEYNGVDVLRTKKLFYTALVIYQRGDYLLALSKLQETRSSYLYEAKGEYNVLVQIKNNPLQSFGIFLLISGAGVVLTLATKYRIYKNRIKLLGEEEQLLLQLMKTVQRECFERNKMSMEEYSEAMIQYEKKLAEAIEGRIMTETKLANLFNLKGKSVALSQEKSRLVALMKTLQSDYLVKGKIETRIYDNMLKTYSTRLSKVEEEMVFIEANEAIRKSK